jgi:competence protein ComEC
VFVCFAGSPSCAKSGQPCSVAGAVALILISVAWLAAMAAVGVWDAPWWMGGAWALALSPLLARWREAGWATAAVCVAAALVGGWLFADWHDRETPGLVEHIRREVTLEGVVSSEADPGSTVVRYRVDVESVDGEAAGGAVLISVNQYRELVPGERVRVAGEIEQAPVFEGFDYRAYLRSQGISGTMLFPEVETLEEAPRWSWRRISAEVRLELERSLQRALPEPEASLAGGIAFGRDANLPDDLAQDFRDTGLAHLTAVSGSNVTIVTGLVFYLVTPLLGRRRAIPVAAAALMLYVLAAGLTWSVLRAGVMAGVFLGGIALGRPQASLAALGLAAVVLTAVEPSAAADVGFQLSFAATAGIIVFAPWLRVGVDRAMQRLRLAGAVPGALVQVAAMTVAASMATLPIQWVVFERVSLVAVVANIVVEPVFAVAMVLSVATAVAGLAWEPAGWAVGLMAYYPLAFTNWVAATFARVPSAAIEVPSASAEMALGAYGLALIPGWVAYRRLAPAIPDRRREPRARSVRRVMVASAAGGLALAVVPVTLMPASGPGELEVAFLDVGQGDAILVTTPGGKQVLVDGGPSGIGLARELGEVMPHWDRSLDMVVLSHPQEDHVGGLPGALDRFDVGVVYATAAENGTESVQAFEARSETELLSQDGIFELDGVRFDVLWPPAGYGTEELNDSSLVLLVSYGDVSVLLTGDIEAGAQRELLAGGGIEVDVLKVPHHGSKTSDAGFLRSLGAGLAVISAGEGNRFGHPHEETLRALEGMTVLRTDVDGRVVVRSDGEGVRVWTER